MCRELTCLYHGEANRARRVEAVEEPTPAEGEGEPLTES